MPGIGKNNKWDMMSFQFKPLRSYINLWLRAFLLNFKNLPNYENRKLPKTESMTFEKQEPWNSENFRAKKFLLVSSPDPSSECILANVKIEVSFKLSIFKPWISWKSWKPYAFDSRRFQRVPKYAVFRRMALKNTHFELRRLSKK